MLVVFTGHTPLATDHCNTLAPTVRPVTLDVGDAVLAITAVPDTSDQLPTPVEGAVAFSAVVGVLMHKDWLPPANAGSGTASSCIVRFETLEQAPLAVVQARTTGPEARLDTVVTAEDEFAKVPVPEVNDQEPDPTLGTTAARAAVGVPAQTV